MNFSKKHTVVTGGSNGIGRALCALLASKGAHVLSLDVERPSIEVAGVTHVHCDVSKLDDVRAAFAQIGGTIDLLALNAGVIRRGPVLAHPESEFDQLFGVNAKGAWLLLKEGVSLLSPHAIVLQVSSYRAGQSPDDPGLYAASKAAGEHLLRCAADSGSFTAKIARLGPVDTAMARHDVEGETLKQKESIMRPVDAIAAMLLELVTGANATLTYDPKHDAYSFA